jgi:hypothetical protein
MQCPCPRCKQKRAYVPLMERVRRYVEWCCDRGWKPVLTLPQFRAIYLLVAAGWHIPVTDAAPGGIRATLFGSPFTISNDPRPQMRIGGASLRATSVTLEQWARELSEQPR